MANELRSNIKTNPLINITQIACPPSIPVRLINITRIILTKHESPLVDLLSALAQDISTMQGRV